MEMPYLVLTIVLAAIAAFSGVGKLRRDPRIVQVVHEVVGVPLQYFPLLAACEIAGAVGLVLGICGQSWEWLRAWAWSFTSWGRLSRICVWAI
jgi:DoxX-like family